MWGVRNFLEVSVQLTKIFFLLSFAFFSPRLFLRYSSALTVVDTKDRFFLGAENITDITKPLFMLRTGLMPKIALITNYSGIDQSGDAILHRLHEQGIVVERIAVPVGCDRLQEFTAQKIKKECNVDQIPLYTADRSIDESVFKDCQALVFDMSDVSIAYHAYVGLVHDIVLYAQQHKKPLIVLDRPSLMGETIEGVLFSAEENKGGVPFRSGMTTGELFQYVNNEYVHGQADLRVVPMCNFQRLGALQKYALCCLSARDKACCVSGSGVLGIMAHVEPLDVAIGTDKAYSCLLLPESIVFGEQKWFKLRQILKEHGIESRLYSYYNTHKKEYMRGLECSLHTIEKVPLLDTLVSVLSFFKQNNVPLVFSPYFDVVTGSTLVRNAIEGSITRIALQEKINNDLHLFIKKARSSFIYHPLPEVVLL